MRSLTRSTMRLSTSAWSAGARARTRVKLTRDLRMDIRTFISERKIPLVNHDIVTASGLLDQRSQEAVGALLAQLGGDLAPRLLERYHLRRQALGDLEDVETVVGGHQAAHLARLEIEDELGEGRRQI